MEVSWVIIFTPDVKRLADFYSKCFKLSQVGEANEHWTELDAGGCSIALHNVAEYGTERDGWVKIVFAAEDVPGEKARLEGLGVKRSAASRAIDAEKERSGAAGG